MSNYDIGLSGIDAAQKALNVIGNNIANAATEGYHRQEISFIPMDSVQIGTLSLGRGVEVDGINRMINTFLEKQILRQQSDLGQVSQESDILSKIENSLGELTTEGGGLNAMIDQFFNSLQNLSAHPSENIWQSQIVSDAETMAGQFRTLGEFLESLDDQVTLEVENTIDDIGVLASQIAELNSKIETVARSGGTANTLCDQRDMYVGKLSELIGIQTFDRTYGMVDINAGGIPLVINDHSTELETGYGENGDFGIGMALSSNYITDVQGGKLGGLLSLKNDIISDIHDDLDSLAEALIQQINQYHVQGVGSEGSFTSLTGQTNVSEDLADISGVTDGSIFVRVTNTITGAITRTEIVVDADNDSLTDIATDMSAITGISASVNSSNQLVILADANYKFDFLPAVGSLPTVSTLTGSPPDISISGIYNGTGNDTLTFTVSGTGSVGNGTLALVVSGLGGAITTVNVGAGYAAGDSIEIGQTGIKIALSTGNLNNTETFKADVFGNSDTSGVLAAVGINTFFSGNDAGDISVCSNISANPKTVATALGADMTDNTNALRMAAVKNQTLADLNSMTCGEFYRRLVSDVGQQMSVKQMRQSNLESISLELSNQKGEISGVDINEEAAKMLIFEQMFQAMAKYMTVSNTLMETLTSMI